MRDRPLVVELVGLAGAGKSTLARTLLARSEPPVQLDLPLSRTRSAAAQLVAQAPFLLPYLREARGTAWFTRDQVRGLGYLHAWQGSLNRGAPAGPCLVLDHGPLFRLAQLDAFGPPVASTTAFQRWWDATLDEWAELLDLVVCLDAPEQLLVQRIRSRDQQHVLRGADEATSRDFLGRYRASYDRVLGRVRRRSPEAVLTLRTDADTPEALALQVLGRLGRGARLDV